MSWGAFAGGFAKTFDPRLVGGAINEGYAQAGYDERVKAAEEEAAQRQQALADTQGKSALDNQSVTQAQQQVAGQAIPTGPAPQQQSTEPQSVMTQNTAIPTGTDYTQPVNTQVGPMSNDEALSREGAAAALREKAPPKMSAQQREFEESKIAADKQLGMLKAKQEYYKRRGMTEKAAELDEKIGYMQDFHMPMMEKWNKYQNGDVEVQDQVLNLVNAMSPDGNIYKRDANGGFDLTDPTGKVLQQGIQFTPQQMNSAWRQAYGIARLKYTGDFDKFMDFTGKEHKMALDTANYKLGRDKLAETTRSNKVNEALRRDQHKLAVANAMATWAKDTRDAEIAAQQREEAKAAAQRAADIASQKANWEAAKTEAEIEAQRAKAAAHDAQAAYISGARTDQTTSQAALNAARAGKTNAQTNEIPANAASRRNVDAARAAQLNAKAKQIEERFATDPGRKNIKSIIQKDDENRPYWVDTDLKTGRILSHTYMFGEGDNMKPVRIAPNLTRAMVTKLISENPEALGEDANGIIVLRTDPRYTGAARDKK